MPKGRGVALPSLGREGWGHPGVAGSAGTPGAGQPPCSPADPAASRHRRREGGCFGCCSGGGGGRGVPDRALPGFPVPAACGPPGFSWVSLVSQPAGCCGGLTSGRLTKGPRKSVREDGMAGRGWVSNGCPEAAAAASLKRGYPAFRRAGLAAGSSLKPSGGSA